MNQSKIQMMNDQVNNLHEWGFPSTYYNYIFKKNNLVEMWTSKNRTEAPRQSFTGAALKPLQSVRKYRLMTSGYF